MNKIQPYSDVEIAEIAAGEILPKRNKRWAMELQQAGPTKLLPDRSTPNIDFNGDPKFACHFKAELSDETKNKLINAINDMLEHRSQDLLKPPCSIEVTEGDDKYHVKVHIIFDSFNGIEPDDKKGELCDT